MTTEQHVKKWNFVDMTGAKLAGVEIVRREDNIVGNAQWTVRFPCGHKSVYEGIRIRAAEKKGVPLRCRECLAATGRKRWPR